MNKLVNKIFYELICRLFGVGSLLEITNGKTWHSELKYNLAWVRTLLKNQGYISNVGKGIWVLNENKEVVLKSHQINSIKEEEKKS